MASEKQIAANRANAQRSTGPRTALGKMKSSRNAYRHGLSGPLPFDPMTSAKVDAIAQALVGGAEGEDQAASAAEFARAQFEVLAIRAKRVELISKIDHLEYNTQELHRLVALDRYERYANTRRRRASHKF
jgi:hypothetical protein